MFPAAQRFSLAVVPEFGVVHVHGNFKSPVGVLPQDCSETIVECCVASELRDGVLLIGNKYVQGPDSATVTSTVSHVSRGRMALTEIDEELLEASCIDCRKENLITVHVYATQNVAQKVLSKLNLQHYSSISI